MKFLNVLCVLALALCFMVSGAYAETQSVKVSGDLAIRGFYRDSYDYVSKPAEDVAAGLGTRTGIQQSNQDWIMSTAEVQVEADLTDNVQTVIRLANQRDWNVKAKNIQSDTTLAPNGLGGYTDNPDEFDVELELAYVTLKDFIYSPLTVTIGRQNLWFGKGFIVGSNLNNTDPTGAIQAQEYSVMTAFDAVKAVLDFDPWTITGVYSKIAENAVQASDDVDLWGANVGYKFDSYKAEAEGYWFWKRDRSIEDWVGSKARNEVHTFGLRGSVDPIEAFTVAAEGAYQCGEYLGSRLQINDRSRSAWALDISGECRYFTEKFAWKPKIGAEWVYYSGNKAEESPAGAGGTFKGWDPMYRGKFDSAIREFVGKFYTTNQYPTRSGQLQSSADASFTNQHQVIFVGSLQPVDSLTLKANYNLFWNAKQYIYNDSDSDGYVGSEIDLQANWDYTEDVSFGILAGWFFPGEVYGGGNDEVASDVVGTVKVSF
ncbi:MAG: alginate export family protein [Candidatus Omnitrophota bacterium]